MADIVAPVKDGKIDTGKNVLETNTKRTVSSELGKDAFLQLLVCQMQNQDPLNPSTDTEYVSQLATFSQLEELQNLSSVTENTQAFTLVGKNVVIKTENSDGEAEYVEGIVDYVTMSGTDSKLSIDGALYKFDELYTVLDDTYVSKENAPSIDEAIEYSYNADNPRDLTFKTDFGKGNYAATALTLMLGGQLLDSSYVTSDDEKVTISAAAFAGLPNGTYSPTVVFNDAASTQVNGKLKITVFNSSIEAADNAEGSDGEDAVDGTNIA